MSGLFHELKRRNVFRVAIAYLALAWLIMQIADIVLDTIAAPAWVMKALMFFLVVGFPVVILFAWAYELTPDGLKRERDVDRGRSITHQTGRKLDRAIIAALAAAVVFLLVDKFVLQESMPAAEVTEKSVAVLPFVAMSSGPDDEYFADGLTEEILNSLARMPELLVTARTSAFYFKGKDVPIPEVATTLGVAHVVEGSVRRSGDKMRVTAQLIRANDGFHLWSEQYDRDTEDTFRVQTDIAEKIASALDVVLDESQLAEMRAFGLRDPGAFIALQKGIEAFYRAHEDFDTTSGLKPAQEWLEESVRLQPDQSTAYAVHADYYSHVMIDAAAGGPAAADELAAALAAFNDDMGNAIRYAPDEQSRLSLTYDRNFITGQWRGIRSVSDRIAALATESCNWPGWYEMTTLPFGQADKVLEVGTRGVACDPMNFSSWRLKSYGEGWNGDYQSAVATVRQGFDVTPHSALRYEAARNLILAGDFAQANEIMGQELDGESAPLDLEFRLAAAQGDVDKARGLAQRSEMAGPGLAIAAISRAAMIGDHELANRLAEETDARPFGYLVLIAAVNDCMCGAPFDLDRTPKFGALLDAADLRWPPVSPFEWPLMR